jgi:hypothetical protein
MENSEVAQERFQFVDQDLVALSKICIAYQANFQEIMEDCIKPKSF